MNKKILIGIVGLIVVLVIGFVIMNNLKTNENSEDYQEKKGVLTDTITFGEGDSFYGEIKKHKTSKTAEVEALFALNDTEEVTDFMGEKMYMAPVMVNMVCNVMNMAIFAPEDFDALNEEGDAQEDSDMWDKLEGYEVTRLVITFIDKEDKTQIAKCASTGKDSMEYVAYREYDPEKSFFGAEIGVFEE